MTRIKRTQEEYDEMKRLYDKGFNCWPPKWWRNPSKEERKQQLKEKKHQKVMLKKEKRLSYHEKKFIEGMSKGLNQKDSALFAGYAITSAPTQASRLMHKEKIIRELDKQGLTDTVLVQNIKHNMEAGAGVKATADTSLKATELALRLKGHLQNDEKGDTTNIQINDLRSLSDEELIKRMEMLQGKPLEGETIE